MTINTRARIVIGGAAATAGLGITGAVVKPDSPAVGAGVGTGVGLSATAAAAGLLGKPSASRQVAKTTSYLERLNGLGKDLGQPDAVRVVKGQLAQRAFGWTDSAKVTPILLQGPSGSGKTRLAGNAAEVITGSREGLITIRAQDLGPGYVGHRDTKPLGQAIVEGLDAKPGSPVLIDNIDDFPAQQQDELLRIADTGEVRMADGAIRPVETPLLMVSRPESHLQRMAADGSRPQGSLRSELYGRMSVARFD